MNITQYNGPEDFNFKDFVLFDYGVETRPHPEGGDEVVCRLDFMPKKKHPGDKYSVQMNEAEIENAIPYIKGLDASEVEIFESLLQGVRDKKIALEREARVQEIRVVDAPRTDETRVTGLLVSAFIIAGAVLLGANKVADSIDRNTYGLNRIDSELGDISDALEDNGKIFRELIPQ